MRKALNQLLGAVLVLAAVIGGAWWVADQALQGPTASSSRPSEKCPAREQKCQGDKHIYDAAAACTTRIERLANYDHEWTTGFGEKIFSQFAWLDRERRVMRYMGEKIKLQNGFGAWQPHWYWCDYRIPDGVVLKVGAPRGRL